MIHHCLQSRRRRRRRRRRKAMMISLSVKKVYL
jgi:hypothetical protein